MPVTRKIDADYDFSGIGKIIRALLNPVASDPGTPGIGEVWFNTTAGRLKANTAGGIESIAWLDDVTAGSVTGALWDAQSVVVAVTDDSPTAQVLGLSTVLGRRASGNIGAVSYANLVADLEAIGITADTLGTKSEAQVLARANHTGTQLASTISDFNTAADARAQAIVDALIDAAPGTLNTLNELAAALGDDPNFASTITTAIATKTEKFVDQVGDGTNTLFTVNHALGTTSVTVAFKLNSTGQQFDAFVDVVDANNVQVGFNTVYATDAVEVTVIG